MCGPRGRKVLSTRVGSSAARATVPCVTGGQASCPLCRTGMSSKLTHPLLHYIDTIITNPNSLPCYCT